MQTNSHPIVFYKKIDITYTKDEENHHEVKITKYFFPHINLKSVTQILKILIFILLIITVITDRTKEVAPIITSVLKQLQ